MSMSNNLSISFLLAKNNKPISTFYQNIDEMIIIITIQIIQ